jgi:hypothetical protein
VRHTISHAQWNRGLPIRHSTSPDTNNGQIHAILPIAAIHLLSANRICLLAMLQLSFFYELDEGNSLLSPLDAASRAEVT